MGRLQGSLNLLMLNNGSELDDLVQCRVFLFSHFLIVASLVFHSLLVDARVVASLLLVTYKVFDFKLLFA